MLLTILATPAFALTAQQIVGTWLFRGIPGQVCTIQAGQNGGIVATTEKGVQGQGDVMSGQGFYVDFPFGYVEATLSPDGNTITWSNGEHWIRQGAAAGVQPAYPQGP